MTEREDTDIDFDFFEEEPPTEEASGNDRTIRRPGGPRGPQRPSAPTNLTLHQALDINVPIGCGDAPVFPGDVIVGDSDGVIVIPPALAEEVADATLAQEAEDSWIADQVAAGHPLDGLFPMNAEWKARYQEWRRTT